MDAVAWIALVIVIVLMVVVKGRNADKNYTIGKSIFKSSEYNIDEDKQKDAFAHDFYDEAGKLK